MLKSLIFAPAVLLGSMLLVSVLLGGASPQAAGDVKPLEQILKELPRKYDGRTLDTRLKGSDYTIRILLRSGEVVELVVDGVTGQIKKEKEAGGQ